MTRAECIEAMARAIDPDAWDPDAKAYGKNARHKASLVVAEDAYEALQPHIQAERERVREALEFHRDEWVADCGDHGVPVAARTSDRLRDDWGDVARAALGDDHD